ncbi:MAG TPA: hemerythrin domain-containing protein [Gallionella sp.]
MKRHPALQPLSREHHAALKLAKACERAVAAGQADETCRRAVAVFATELEPHFRVEERELLPLLDDAGQQGLAERTLAEHAGLRALAVELRQCCDAGVLQRFGAQLAAHVRFEERELFPALETLL